MNLMVISLAFLILILAPISIAADLQISAPSEVNINENFTVKILSDVTDKSDVKIYVQDSESKIVSEIFSSAWKSSFYYLLSAFPEYSQYTLHVKKSSGNFTLCAKLRKTGSKSIISSPCVPFLVKETSVADKDSPPAEETQVSNNRTRQEERSLASEQSALSSDEVQESAVLPLQNELTQIKNNSPLEKNEKIILNSPLNSNSLEEYITPAEKSKLVISYAFSVLVILILILILKRKI